MFVPIWLRTFQFSMKFFDLFGDITKQNVYVAIQRLWNLYMYINENDYL